MSLPSRMSFKLFVLIQRLSCWWITKLETFYLYLLVIFKPLDICKVLDRRDVTGRRWRLSVTSKTWSLCRNNVWSLYPSFLVQLSFSVYLYSFPSYAKYILILHNLLVRQSLHTTFLSDIHCSLSWREKYRKLTETLLSLILINMEIPSECFAHSSSHDSSFHTLDFFRLLVKRISYACKSRQQNTSRVTWRDIRWKSCIQRLRTSLGQQCFFPRNRFKAYSPELFLWFLTCIADSFASGLCRCSW
jgi:hypothetical protein